MQNQYGIWPHLQKFYQAELSPAQVPTQNLLSSLKKLLTIAQQKQQLMLSQSQLHQQLSTHTTHEEVRLIKQYRQQIKINDSIVRIVELVQQIDTKVGQFKSTTLLEDKLQVFRSLYGLMGRLQHRFIQINNQEEKKKQANQPHQQQQLKHLKHQYLHSLQQTLATLSTQTQPQTQAQPQAQPQTQALQQSLSALGLPIKKQSKQQPPQPSPSSQLNPSHMKYIQCIRQVLFSQYCCYCLLKKIEIVLDEDEGQGSRGEDGQFQSVFFGMLWGKATKAIQYIFLNTAGQAQSAYQIEQPNWMFEYIEQQFTLNYQFLVQRILKPIPLPLHKQLNQYIQTYLLSYNLDNLFLKYVYLRLQVDISVITAQQKQQGNKRISQEVAKRNSFLIFNYLDQLNMLGERMMDRYDFQVDFMESVIMRAKQETGFDVLSRNFDYEHEFIEQRIFTDFSNINYSNITDLKNIQAYNITINFINIFQKLYNKFRKIKNQQLHLKINQFYNQKILQLCRHIVTSFQRIYNYSNINKYQILTSYKKIENQFYSYFNSFIIQSPAFEAKIKEEYYSVLGKYVEVLALEELTNVHKKVYKRLSDNNAIFCNYTFQPSELPANKDKWNKIFQQWKSKLEKINKLQQQYEDKKLRNIFFTFLESIEFCQDGYLYFISILQPFLIVMFSVQETKTIKMLLQMDKSALAQYCKTHQNMLWFLSGAEIRAIKKCKIDNK